MTIRIFLICAALATYFANGISAHAAALTVSPIFLSIGAPEKTTSLTVRNENNRPITVQVRVFRWVIEGGKDNFQETRDVVASPPIATIGANGDLQVRVLRVTNAPVRGEENFRVVVDEVPDANRVRNVGVNVALRYTLPLFFLDPSASQPRLAWSIRGQGRGRVLVATNSGDKHVRIANLAVGKVTVKAGLAGYVLGKSQRVFDLPPNAPAGGAITADTGQGRLNAAINR